jgi:hypothetical protein
MQAKSDAASPGNLGRPGWVTSGGFLTMGGSI